MPHTRSHRRARLAAILSVALALTGLQFLIAAPAAQADVSTKIATFPYNQDWSDAGLITANDTWTGVNGVQGYLGQDITTATNGTDPQLLGESAVANDTDVIANNNATLNTNTTGGVIESELNQAIALQGSGTADAPYLAFHFDLSGQTNAQFSFDAKDLDGSADNAAQQIGVHYRVGNSGAWTNLPDGYIPDATTQNTATQVTHKDVAIPAGADGQGDVYVRVMTTNAPSNDELVGIDNIEITVNAGPTPVTVTSPGPKTGTVGIAITPFNLAATGGTPPYTWEAVSGMPPGITVATDGTVSGTPTTAGDYDPIVEATDSAGTPVSDTETFAFDISAAPAVVNTIAEVQGTSATTPLDGQTVTVEGEVTASYPTGGLNGFYIQTPGADTTPNASDGIFVYGGPGGFSPAVYPAVGDSVSVTGTAGEFSGATQITSTDGGVQAIADLPGDVVEKTSIPGAGCALPGTACDAFPALNAAREVIEGEALQPADDFTATDVYDFGPYIAFDGGAGSSNSSSFFGEIGLAANSDMPLVSPTEVIDAQATADRNARIAYNNAHRIVLDDGSSTNYTSATGSPFPWLTPTHQVRVGAAVTFPAPVIFTFGFNTWRLIPSSQVVGAPNALTQPQFEQTRADNLAPQDVGGDVKLATFNVLNFFPTTGNEFVAMGGGRTCTYFLDREGNQITNNSCNPNGPRGAANTANLVRQRDKIVAAINAAGADIVSLEELENSIYYGKPRDFAINELVTALNADAGPGTWAAVPSPAAGNLPPQAEQDVIRNGFIYKPAAVTLVGDSVVLADESTGTEAFADAREPLAQAFKAVGTPDADAFAVIVNHFKSKGSGTPDPDGQGNANDRRILQASSLVDFADEFKALRGLTRVFLAGDFNAYSEEDPIQILNAAGYTNLESTSNPDEESYNFDGQIGSLDHVLANAAALADVEDVDIWEINSNESVYYEYSRYNYNVTNLYLPGPFKSSDHNPEIIGIDTADAVATEEVQILGTNDFHGRIANDPLSAAAGAGVMAGAVKQLRAANPNTVFAAAGDLIGASTFESFILNDKPTIDALNEAGLDVSSVGNHEFDQGYDDLVDRVMAPFDATTNPDGGAEWEYIAANVRLDVDDSRALAPTWTQEFGDVKVGFVGAVTEHLPELVSPGGIEEIYVTDVVDEVNDAAEDLKADGADIVVMLVHEGAAGTNCATMDDDPASDFGSIVTGVSADVDAIVSGHTHLEYNCSFLVPEWVTAGRAVTERPVVSSGQYGAALNQIVFTVDGVTGEVIGKSQAVLKLKSCANSTACTNYPVDQPTQDIVDDALAEAAVLGAVPLGEIAGPIKRGYLANGTTENRGTESALGNLVAEAQRWQTSGAEAGSAQIAFMNPGGLRTDMVGVGTGPFPRVVNYKQAAEVQPFANGLVNMDLTGAQIKAALEQQWQPGGASRPFLKLGASAGFTYTSDPDAAQGSRITGMWLNGVAIDPATVYSVTVNSFLSTGGDNFTAFAGGTNKAEAGLTDLQAMVNYLDEFANTGEGDAPLPVPAKQNGVHVNFPPAPPATYAPGEHVTFDVSGWSFSNSDDPLDTAVVVKLGATTLGTFPLNNAAQAALPGFDIPGTTSVDVTLPAALLDGVKKLVLTGATTGTEIPVLINVDGDVEEVQILGTNDFHGRIANDPLSAAAGAGVLAGAVKQLRAANPNTVFAAAGDLIGASTFESFILNDKPTIDALNEAGLDVSSVGNHEFDQGYDDLVDRVMAPFDATTNPDGGAEWAYLGANVRFKANDNPALPATWTKDFGDVRVGFVGTVTEHLPELVSPGGIEDIKVTDVVDETNAAADDLVDNQGADLVIMLVHEGAPATSCATIGGLAPETDFGSIVQGVNENVDAIVSGHTHLAYNCSFPVDEWVTAGRAVTERPVVSSGQYGTNLNQIVFTVDGVTGEVAAKTQALLPLKSCANSTACTNYPVDQPTQDIVDDALAEAAVLGAVPLGEIAGPIKRGYLANGTTENRGTESALGNLVAEAQRWQTSGAEAGSAQIAFMNPGGLRTDMVGVGTGPFPRVVNYKQAAEVQPFANGLVNMDLTGAQIKAALEQQWQPGGASRPFLKLGASAGFTYTSDPDAAQGSRITGMWLNGVAIDPATVYSVTVNSFLSTGGDNFTAFAGGTNKAEAGLTDLQAMVNYLDEFANTGEGDAPLPVPAKQNGVHVNFPPAPPATYAPGEHVTFDVSGWSFSNSDDPLDTAVVVKLGATTLGTFPLNNAAQAALPGFDIPGTTSVDVTLPAGTPGGAATLLLTGATTGTEIKVPITVTTVAPVTPTVTVSAPTMTYGKSVAVTVNVAATGHMPTGTVQIKNGATVLGTGALTGGTATITLPALSLTPGTTALTAVYSGDANVSAQTAGFNQTVNKAVSTVTIDIKPGTIKVNKTKGKIVVKVKAEGVVPVTGKVKITVEGQGTKTIKLEDGKAVLKLDVFTKTGKRDVTVKYLGNDLVEDDKVKDVINVKP